MTDHLYPGTTRRIGEQTTALPTQDEIEPAWTKRGKKYPFNGREVTFYPIGALADALGYKPTTIHKWERMGWLPKTKLRGAVQGNMGGRRRLYTREQIETIVRIAGEEGLLDNPNLPMKSTNFPQRVRLALEALQP